MVQSLTGAQLFMFRDERVRETPRIEMKAVLDNKPCRVLAELPDVQSMEVMLPTQSGLGIHTRYA